MLKKVLDTPGKARSAASTKRPRAYSKCCGLTKPEKRPRKQRRSRKESSVQWAVFERVLQVDNPTFRKVNRSLEPFPELRDEVGLGANPALGPFHALGFVSPPPLTATTQSAAFAQERF
jgi:hypothetical protein